MPSEMLLFGEANAGKDAFANVLVKDFDAVTVALADPMKRLCQQVFGFSSQQLWGASEFRNTVDDQLGDYKKAGATPAQKLVEHGRFWIAEVLDREYTDEKVDLALPGLYKWFEDLPMALSPRIALQLLGTQWGRSIDLNLWIKVAQRAQRKLVTGGYRYSREDGLSEATGAKYSMAVITDGRFRNEALEFKAGGATTIKIVDPDGKQLAAGIANHASEMEQKTVPNHWFDVVYSNKKDGLDRLTFGVHRVMEHLSDVPIFVPTGRSLTRQ